jgi:ketosteroid isomerase-like protein
MTERDKKLMELTRLLYADSTRERELVSPEIVWHVPGHNPVSGDYHGHAEYFETMVARMGELARWEFDLTRVMVNGDYVVSQFHLVGDRNESHVDLNGSHILRFDDKDQIVEGWGFTDDQDALDAFYSAG